MNKRMRDLSCNRLEMDEIWRFVGKKEKHVKPEDDGVGICACLSKTVAP